MKVWLVVTRVSFSFLFLFLFRRTVLPFLSRGKINENQTSLQTKDRCTIWWNRRQSQEDLVRCLLREEFSGGSGQSFPFPFPWCFLLASSRGGAGKGWSWLSWHESGRNFCTPLDETGLLQSAEERVHLTVSGSARQLRWASQGSRSSSCLRHSYTRREG